MNTMQIGRVVLQRRFGLIRPVLMLAILGLAACKPVGAGDDIRVTHVPKDASAPPSAPVAMAATPDMTAFAQATKTPKWSPPADWQADPPNSMRKGSWHASALDGKDSAAISVDVFAGQLGGLLANVNRWRGQVGLPDVADEAAFGDTVKDLTVDGKKAKLVSLDGPDGKSIDGLFLFEPDRTWTFKMSGTAAAVKAQRPAFQKFLESVQWQD